ncbi:MAG TPA: S-adenosylmethionine:tRNA ribosyltransferase-isomerase, partial [Propionibacteriaceae bacterium]|nr:S-adenosylmethionine:tRNA ribosyltransferase-isomerase [Propionibacteriaceae bacterium]
AMSTILTARPLTRFASPEDRTATEPPELRGLRRDGVRLLVATPAAIRHTVFYRLGDQLRAGDVLVVNTSATVPGQVDGTRDGSAVVVHLANRLNDGTRVVELRTAPDASAPVLDGRAGERIGLPAGGVVELIAAYPELRASGIARAAQEIASGSSPTGVGNRLWRGRVTVPQKLSHYLREQARPISYGYLIGSFPISAYQTIFALCPGSAEMPSAGRPFSADLVARLVGRGVIFAPITLHTGLSSQDVGEVPQPEWFEVSETTADLVNSSRARGGRVIAVGTTATRAIESAASPDGIVTAASGWTDLVISPERPVRVVDGLITGWHNPEASHLLLVESVAGAELTQRAYDAAVAEHYLWHEFGDSCLLLRDG